VIKLKLPDAISRISTTLRNKLSARAERSQAKRDAGVSANEPQPLAARRPGAGVASSNNSASRTDLNQAEYNLGAIRKITRQVLDWFYARSGREQALVLATIVFVLVTLANQAYTPLSTAFSDQAQELAALERNATATPAVIERYGRLHARREQLEKRFKEIEFKDGALSYIENLVRQQPGVAPGFDIRESSPRSFGKAYQQQPFLVRFQTTNAQGLVEFLKSVVRGERSLLITKLEIQKPRRGDRLEVDLELNTIKKSEV